MTPGSDEQAAPRFFPIRQVVSDASVQHAGRISEEDGWGDHSAGHPRAGYRSRCRHSPVQDSSALLLPAGALADRRRRVAHLVEYEDMHVAQIGGQQVAEDLAIAVAQERVSIPQPSSNRKTCLGLVPSWIRSVSALAVLGMASESIERGDLALIVRAVPVSASASGRRRGRRGREGPNRSCSRTARPPAAAAGRRRTGW